MPRGVSQWEPGIPRFPRGEKRKYEVDHATGCFIWFGALNSKGRPIVRQGYKTVLAYVYFYELEHGPVPRGKELHHFECDNRVCVNPNHVRPETKSRNTTLGNLVRWELRNRDIPF